MKIGLDYPCGGRLRDDISTLASAGVAIRSGARWSRDARVAFDRFHQHFARRVHAYCDRTTKKRLPEWMSVASFAAEVMHRLTRDLHRLCLPPAASPAEVERLVLTFVCGQVRWALNDLLRDAEMEDVPDDFVHALKTRGHGADQPSTPQYLSSKRKLDNALSKMDAKDRDILHTSFRYLDMETKRFTLPDSERDRLCRDWKFANSNALCQYRKRRLNELKNVLTAVA